ncbi:RICIN domain-containing protein [Salinactinospora qingdaonensis]|uniref:RICIN domain-containing protein n=1 Tax=Salinactinospora qingdaonensis TaxID=702744 RepID=A0ABP7GEK0_9ACTN
MTSAPRSSPRLTPLLAALLTVTTSCALTVIAAPPAGAESSVTITPDPSYQGQRFEGWGTSLVWFANATGDYPDSIREELAGLLFDEDGLNLNIARYNVGGGNAPDVTNYLRAGAAVEGWWNAPEGTTRDDTDWWSADDPDDWNADADQTQRWWVERLKDDIDHWEAFSNSPPWFMTESGYVSGGFDGNTDQLKDESVADFAGYLVGVAERLEDAHGIEVDTIDPFNEPNTDYWSTWLNSDGEPVGGRQEGAHMGPQLQQDVIRALAGELTGADTDAVISAMDETNPGRFADNWLSYPQEVRDLVDQLNVHTYGTGSRTTVRDLAKAAEKPLWMSEVGGDWGDGQNFESMDPGLGLAQHITDDLRELEPSAWVFWQPVEDYDNMAPGGESAEGGNWGSIQLPFDCTAQDTLETCPIRTNTKFDTARNFTHYIQPGDRLVKVGDTSSVAAVSPSERDATVVHVNDSDAPRAVTVDLSNFSHVDHDATMTPIVTDADGALVEHEAVSVTDDRATFTVPAESVTTFVVDRAFGVDQDAAAVQRGDEYRLTGVQSDKSLAASDDGTATVIRTTAPDDEAQLWRLSKVIASPDGDWRFGFEKRFSNRQRYVVTNEGTDGRLAVRDGALVLEPDQGPDDEAAQWTMSTTGDGSWTFVNAATGQLIDVAGQATHDGAAVSVWSPNSGANQRWTVTTPEDAA